MQYQRILEAFEQKWMERQEKKVKFGAKKIISDTLDIKDLISLKEVKSYTISSINYQNIQLNTNQKMFFQFIFNYYQIKSKIILNSIPQNNQQQTNQSKVAPKKIRLKQQLQEECPICMINLDDLQNVCEIDACKHQICLHCIKEWAEKYKTQCPYCRANFKKIYPIENGKRKKTPIKLDLKKPKWQPEQDQFYNSQEDQEENQKCQLCGCSHSQYLMLVCDKCNEQMCHTFCDPGFLEFFIPEKNWYCLDCRKSKLIYHKPK